MTRYKQTLSDLLNASSNNDYSENSVHNLMQRQIILYGAGNGLITFSIFVIQRYNLQIDKVLDRKFKSGNICMNVPAFSPFEYTPTNQEKEDAVVIITIGTKEYHQEIFNTLFDIGYKNVILATDIYEYHLLHPTPDIEKNGSDYYLAHKDKMLNCMDLFVDDLSCEVYLHFLQTHIQRKPIQIPHRPLEEQYFPGDIKVSKGYSHFINCGAFNGDTIKQLSSRFGKVDTAICFEPEADNFNLLSQYLTKNHSKIAQNIFAFPCGVFSHHTQLYFAGGNKFNSMISNNGDSVIQCVALDDVLPGFESTFITMDVEGAEPEALKGSEMLIKRNKPDLAICVYHAPNHIWDIPLYLESLGLKYKFYLRNYTSFISETVLYAV